MQKTNKRHCNCLIIFAYLILQILLTFTISVLQLHLCVHLFFVGAAFLAYVAVTSTDVRPFIFSPAMSSMVIRMLRKVKRRSRLIVEVLDRMEILR